jgi:hypothetical protein
MLVNIILLFFTILLIYQFCYPSTIIEGLSDECDLNDHDAIIEIQAELNTKYKPLIVNDEGKPVNLLSRVAALESDVKNLGQSQVNQMTDNAMNDSVSDSNSPPITI